MENKNNQSFIAYESEELTRQKILNSALMDELIKYKEENTKLKHEKEILNSKIEKLEEENQTLKSDFSSMKSKNGHEETMEIIENILHSNHEIKDEPLDYGDLAQKSCDKSSNEEELEQNKDDYKLKPTVIRPRLKPKKSKMQVVSENNQNKRGKYKKNKSEEKEDANHVIKCELCDSIFTGKNLRQCKSNLKIHIRTVHEGERNFPCHKCNKPFWHPWHRRRHIQSVHEKLKPIKCDICGKSFSEAGYLKKHKNTKKACKSFSISAKNKGR